MREYTVNKIKHYIIKFKYSNFHLYYQHEFLGRVE